MHNNNQISFYDILNIYPNESLENIKLSYKNKIKYFKNKNLNENDIINIKKLKTAFFILTNYQLRTAYNNLLIQKIEESKNHLEVSVNNNDIPETNNSNIINDVAALNDDNNINLDELFQINTLKIESNLNHTEKSTKMNNIISNRIFSIPNTQKIMINNILPQQTREERKLL
jgi:DnaJ-class molecular chaperone